MIIKKREIPVSIPKLQSLLRRLPQNHQKIPLIQETLLKHQAGYRGEIAIDYPLSFLPEKDYLILHDLRLHVNNHYFQMDTLILSKRYFLILEIKNIAGTLFFDDEFQQLIRSQENREEAFPSPILQVNRHVQLLTQWVALHGFPKIPIHALVVISNPYSVLRSSSKQNSSRIIHHDYLPDRILQWDSQNLEPLMTEKEIKKISRQLIKQNTPNDYTVLNRFQISMNELITGAYCSVCGNLPLLRKHGYWSCMKCNLKSRIAHKESLMDFKYLWGSTITSKQLQHFLHISCPSLATRILKSMNLPSTGTKKGTVYDLTSLGH